MKVCTVLGNHVGRVIWRSVKLPTHLNTDSSLSKMFYLWKVKVDFFFSWAVSIKRVFSSQNFVNDKTKKWWKSILQYRKKWACFNLALWTKHKNINLKDVLIIISLSRIEAAILPKVWLTVRRPIWQWQNKELEAELQN